MFEFTIFRFLVLVLEKYYQKYDFRDLKQNKFGIETDCNPRFEFDLFGEIKTCGLGLASSTKDV